MAAQNPTPDWPRDLTIHHPQVGLVKVNQHALERFYQRVPKEVKNSVPDGVDTREYFLQVFHQSFQRARFQPFGMINKRYSRFRHGTWTDKYEDYECMVRFIVEPTRRVLRTVNPIKQRPLKIGKSRTWEWFHPRPGSRRAVRLDTTAQVRRVMAEHDCRKQQRDLREIARQLAFLKKRRTRRRQKEKVAVPEANPAKVA